MMKWPWVSRAYMEYVRTSGIEAEKRLLGEIDWLKEELAKALEKRDRIDRVDAGLSELPKAPPKPREPMPPELTGYILAFGNMSAKRQMRAVAYRRYANGESWEAIVADVVKPDEPREIFYSGKPSNEEDDEGTEEEAERSTTTEV